MKKYKIKSYCKINLSLNVVKKIESGYHNISSIITFCGLYDLITVCKISGTKDKVNFTGKFSSNINKKKNTITKVLSLLRINNFLKKDVFKVNIEKNIPHGSGLGGGSSNAASLLNFFSFKKNLKLNNKQLTKIARHIGFDVPISLERRNTLLTGRKDQILRLKQRFALNILIVYPNIICSTKEVYKKNKSFNPIKFQTFFGKKNNRELINFLKSKKNDLQKTVIKLHPKVGEIIDFLTLQRGCFFSRITGSGSACIGIFSSLKTANSAKKLIKLNFPKCWCVVSKTI